jgi:hypothetical protein
MFVLFKHLNLPFSIPMQCLEQIRTFASFVLKNS